MSTTTAQEARETSAAPAVPVMGMSTTHSAATPAVAAGIGTDVSTTTDETVPQLSPAAKAVATRRRHKALADGGSYGALLGELWGAQEASDHAKSRPGNGKRRREFGRYQGAESNYRASRWARLRGYREKERHLAQACALLEATTCRSSGGARSSRTAGRTLFVSGAT